MPYRSMCHRFLDLEHSSSVLSFLVFKLGEQYPGCYAALNATTGGLYVVGSELLSDLMAYMLNLAARNKQFLYVE
jgi:hypothetical protein